MCGIVGFTGNRQAAPILLDCPNWNIEGMTLRGWQSVMEKPLHRW